MAELSSREPKYARLFFKPIASIPAPPPPAEQVRRASPSVMLRIPPDDPPVNQTADMKSIDLSEGFHSAPGILSRFGLTIPRLSAAVFPHAERFPTTAPSSPITTNCLAMMMSATG